MPFPAGKEKIELSFNLAMQLFQNTITESAPLSRVLDIIISKFSRTYSLFKFANFNYFQKLL